MLINTVTDITKLIVDYDINALISLLFKYEQQILIIDHNIVKEDILTIITIIKQEIIRRKPC